MRGEYKSMDNEKEIGLLNYAFRSEDVEKLYCLSDLIIMKDDSGKIFLDGIEFITAKNKLMEIIGRL